MKTILAISLSVLSAALTAASCTSVSDIEPATLPEVSGVHAAKVTGIIPSTRALSGSSVKSEWTSEDWIYAYNGGKHSYFKANEEGSDSSFTLSGSSSDWSDGEAYAAYPKSVKFTEGKYKMTFQGQNGTYDGLYRFNLMTSKATVRNGEASFTFSSRVAVLAIPAEEILYNDTKATKVVVSGENFSSVVSVDINGGDFRISAEGNEELVVNSPVVEDGMIFVAIVPTTGSLSVDLYDNIGGHFFSSIADAGTLSTGTIHDMSGEKWDGGIEITFNPSVADWD